MQKNNPLLGFSDFGCQTSDGNITNAKGETVSTEVGTVSVSIDKDSTWTLTADTYITSFDGDISSVNTNGYTLYINGVAM